MEDSSRTTGRRRGVRRGRLLSAVLAAALCLTGGIGMAASELSTEHTHAHAAETAADGANGANGAALRPGYHFTAAEGWINDPNGLVYNAATGEYNLFYQCNLTLKEDINAKCWGHAVSRDLMHWTELAPALLPDEHGAIWSGSAVIDRDNTSGLFDDGTPPDARMVAFFTYYGGDLSLGAEKQGMAYSVDNGRTWIKFAGNPIITAPEITDGFRDPKVFRFTDADGRGQWGMLVAGGKARLYTSADLKTWTFSGYCRDVNGALITTECPDLFPLSADDGSSCWVLSCAGRSYYTGTLTPGPDGSLNFQADSGVKVLADGAGDMYACQTFFNLPDTAGMNGAAAAAAATRRIGIYWLIDTTMQGDRAALLPGKNWDGVESLPLEFRLVHDGEGFRLAAYPAGEMYALAGATPVWSCTGQTLTDGELALYPDGDCASVLLRLKFRAQAGARLIVELLKRGGEYTALAYSQAAGNVTLVRSHSSDAVTKNDLSIKVRPQTGAEQDGLVCLDIFTDNSVVSVFDGQGGALEGLVFPSHTGAAGLGLAARGTVEIVSAEIYALPRTVGVDNAGDPQGGNGGNDPNGSGGNGDPNGGSNGSGGDNNNSNAPRAKGGLSAGLTAAIIAAIGLVGLSGVAAVMILSKKR